MHRLLNPPVLPATCVFLAVLSGAGQSAGDPASAPSLTLRSPNGGEAWQRGTRQGITWTSSGETGPFVKIELYEGSNWRRTLAAATPNDGSHEWLIPPALPPRTDYRIKITANANAAIHDVSDAPFSITAPILTVETPNGGESWQRGTRHEITWTWTHSPGRYVKIELYEGAGWRRTIASDTANDGSYTWQIPKNTKGGANYRIRISSTDDAAVRDTSDMSFSIIAPTLTLKAPNGRESWQRGTRQEITWTWTHDPGRYVRIQLYENSIWRRTIATSARNNGSFLWRIPKDTRPSADYRIRISSTADAAARDTSDMDFSITAPTLTVKAPNGRESWPAGSRQEITWTWTHDPGRYVKIELYEGSSWRRTIAPFERNDGSYTWYVPARLRPGRDYRIKITSTTHSSCHDTSDADFAITAAP